jgi:hypothetical protein
MQRIRDKIKAITAPWNRLPEPAGPIVAEINQALRHWGPTFKWVTRRASSNRLMITSANDWRCS